jgi:hypothetical protein
MKETIVTIKGCQYRYAYDPEAKVTKYLGPVGQGPTLTEAEFHRIVNIDNWIDDEMKNAELEVKWAKERLLKQIDDYEERLDDLAKRSQTWSVYDKEEEPIEYLTDINRNVQAFDFNLRKDLLVKYATEYQAAVHYVDRLKKMKEQHEADPTYHLSDKAFKETSLKGKASDPEKVIKRVLKRNPDQTIEEIATQASIEGASVTVDDTKNIIKQFQREGVIVRDDIPPWLKTWA